MPALDDLARAEAHREKALALETYRAGRLARHVEYLDALRRQDRTLLLSLAATELNLAPPGRRVIISPAGSAAPVLERLDVPYVAPTVAMPPESMLHRLATNRHTRLWLIACAAMCVLYGLLPPARRAERSRRPARTLRWRGMLVPARLRRASRRLALERSGGQQASPLA